LGKGIGAEGLIMGLSTLQGDPSIDEVNLCVLPDVLEMPVQSKNGAVVFLGDHCNITVRQIDVFPFPP
jgi:hypothetical protein